MLDFLLFDVQYYSLTTCFSSKKDNTGLTLKLYIYIFIGLLHIFNEGGGAEHSCFINS